jgi:hypothetical protein
MSRKREPGVVSAGGKNKSSCISKNNPDLQNRQSPWANVTAYDPLAEVVRRSQADADRLEATSDDDKAWFDANPGRSFHLRNATPHELDTGLACSWMLVARYSTGRIRLPVPIPALAAHDALEHDTKEKARQLFDRLTWGWTAENLHPFPFGVLQEIQGARHG